MSRIIRYDRNLKVLARKLRNGSTLGEILLWQELKGRQLNGYSFHRQRPIDKYIVDFYCPKLRLAIELDGTSHDQKLVADSRRQ